jgi:replication initiation and membrane attachment protein DnaB
MQLLNEHYNFKSLLSNNKTTQHSITQLLMNACISKFVMKYQIEIWHMDAIEQNTCDYEMNVTTLGP